ncbi:ALDH-like protein [Aspergillus uvarum CBS 121591]|uniref:ALDH-like protein n=1 Tax=Aspergillus uvarum CBS 121591 TaxID=1448315 RepID=A0A319BZV6_9EURO|nr:ALDH-like protein [Aspergillus uvarum CBS 121591]PYH77637.1 ALDH-like protein [Aspergillus uvarum CBS 121591]
MPRSLSELRHKDLFRTQGFIAHQWVDSTSGSTFEKCMRKTPTTPSKPPREHFKTFKKTIARQRAQWLRKWYALCLEHQDDLALILTLENGKPLAEAKGEVAYAASFLDWFASEAERTYGEVVPPANPSQRIITIKEPLGIAACLAPWNFSLAMITRKVGAALAAGCTTVWKPAGETPLSALALAVLAQEAGLPAGSINVLTTLNNVHEVGSALCENRLVRKLSFTGSTRVGKLLAQKCSVNLEQLSLELGGNSPFIVFNDANIETAVDAFLLAKFRNAGQTCITANRVFVQEGSYDRFAAALVERVKSLRVGNGVVDGVTIGPLTHERAVEKAVGHINDAISKGASVLLGGAPFQPDNLKGYFIQPTILSNVTPEAQVTSSCFFRSSNSTLYRARFRSCSFSVARHYQAYPSLVSSCFLNPPLDAHFPSVNRSWVGSGCEQDIGE